MLHAVGCSAFSKSLTQLLKSLSKSCVIVIGEKLKCKKMIGQFIYLARGISFCSCDWPCWTIPFYYACATFCFSRKTMFQFSLPSFNGIDS